MLVLTRKAGQTVTIGEGDHAIDVTVTEVNGDPDHGSVKLAFPDGPDSVWRREISADRQIAAALRVVFDSIRDCVDDTHLLWVLDRMVRELTGGRYDEAVPGDWAHHVTDYAEAPS